MKPSFLRPSASWACCHGPWSIRASTLDTPRAPANAKSNAPTTTPGWNRKGIKPSIVDSVRMNGPAEKAGIRNSDVIVEFDGEHVRSARQLSRLLWETPSARPVKVVVLRGQQRVELSVTPA